ncbi:hypothetical protein D9619_003185 [Psilocybe cf. subviscida]|uniref:Uncharacterized protein n=1 Tax=Psilocybe cf. subviscida TaxID=2480587 RepID=A0A8H5AY25_9AGAR|nr:hypothetical protein D9619_003185 [Psilocybe cf. subviscida]
MSASQFASFAAYTPPPDEQSGQLPQHDHKPSHNAWFSHGEGSYQSGGIPSISSSLAVHPVEVATEERPSTNLWETTYGWRTDILALWAYLLGPISAIALLIWETQNDYVRFHAYQSALVTTPLIFIRMVLSLLSFPALIKGLCTWGIIATQIISGLYAYRQAAANVASPFKFPVVGDIAEQWLADE